MTRPVYVHIGAPKTGTTYLQAVLNRNREALRERGILYPKAKGDAHHVAAWDLRDVPQQRRQTPGITGAWAKLAQRTKSWHEGPVLISSELFVFADDEQARAAVADLGDEVHLIYTARDLFRQVPAVWQERVKNQQGIAYPAFVEALKKHLGSGSHGFWRAQDASAALARWGSTLPPEHIHVVTTPPPGGAPSVLWDRFASVLELSGADFSTEVPGSANSSLGVVATELLRRYNQRHGEGVSWPQYRRTVKVELERSFVRGITGERRLALAPPDRVVFARESERICAALVDAEYDIVGDLADLQPEAEDGPPGSRSKQESSTQVGTDELLDASLDVLHQILSRQEKTRRKRHPPKKADETPEFH